MQSLVDIEQAVEKFSASPKIVPVPVARSTNSPWAKSPLSPSERLSQRIPSVDAR